VQGAPAKAARTGKPAKAQPAPQRIYEERAMALLKATSERLAAAKALLFTATVAYEFPSRLGPALVYTTRYRVAMQRPDRLRIVNLGDGPASEFYYDGKAMMAYAPAENLVAVADAPPTIDGALKQAFQAAGIYFPFTDLLVADPYAALADGVKTAFYIGPSEVVGGVRTEMVAVATDDVFMQIWLGAEDKLPRRIRAVFSADPLRLRHDMELSNWKLDPQLPAETFVSQKAQGAQKMEFAHPVAKQPAGAAPITVRKQTPASATKSRGSAK
ncbi:MAG: DUF2092 domain-containing protein, partial [Azonexus sp.]